MQETMKREQEEAIAMLMRANSALSRIFNVEGEGESKMSTCMGCLNDFNEEDLVWQGGLLCADCKEGE